MILIRIHLSLPLPRRRGCSLFWALRLGTSPPSVSCPPVFPLFPFPLLFGRFLLKIYPFLPPFPVVSASAGAGLIASWAPPLTAAHLFLERPGRGGWGGRAERPGGPRSWDPRRGWREKPPVPTGPLGTPCPPRRLPGGRCVYPHCADEEIEAGSHQVTQHINWVRQCWDAGGRIRAGKLRPRDHTAASRQPR